ncbi:MAG: cysteine--tRNA ligase [Planctomycetes bacterium]|nr:cysteine--tRNA ligase [Planctomycetota bacterium]
MTLKLYNSLTRSKDEFKPLVKGKVGMYVCGPTVYGHAHLGHAKSYISFDILVRYLRYLGYNVTYVQNITDVGHLTDDADQGQDKLDVAARKEHKHPMAIAEYYTRSYFADMDELNCLRPDISPRATGHILEQIEMVKILIEKGYAYESNGSVYFNVSKFKEYGKLSGRNVDEMISGARVEVSPDKRNPADFALWKKAEPNHIMQWSSPWSMGYPGWHIECSVMSQKYLGETIDIHGGGIENKFPHHECEIAQSEAANGVQFVRYWIHNNMVTVDGQKMGKSLNNFITLSQVFSGAHERLTRAYDPIATRQLILNSHYGSPLDFSDASLHSAQSGYEKITEAVKTTRKQIANAKQGDADTKVAEQLGELKKKFEAAMNDDLNTSIGLSVIFELVKLTYSLIEKPETTSATLIKIDDMFSLLGGDVLGIVKEIYPETNQGDDEIIDELVKTFIEQRAQARKDKDFAAADAIRDKLDAIGILLEDKPGETIWRRK